MIRIKKHFILALIVSICISALLLKAVPTFADNSNEEEIFQSVRQTILSRMDTKEEAIYGNEWLALDLARDDQELSPYYLKDLIDTIITPYKSILLITM